MQRLDLEYPHNTLKCFLHSKTQLTWNPILDRNMVMFCEKLARNRAIRNTDSYKQRI